LSLALVFADAVASPHDGAATRIDFDALIPASLPPVEKDVFRKQIQKFAAHTRPSPPADSIPVLNCEDSGSGSLRDAVDHAVDGDTIDLTALDCSTITLTSGAISTALDDLTIEGPGALRLEINGNDDGRVFWHLGAGTLTLDDVTVSHGRKYLLDGDAGNAGGGCVFSLGGVTMDYAWARDCTAASNDQNAIIRGGAIYAQVGVLTESSIVSASQAYSRGSTSARGGGIYTMGHLFVISSTISGNTATTSGGGIHVGAGGEARIKYSSIASNVQSTTGRVLGGGGAYLTGNAYIVRSTISNNSGCRGGGVYFINGGNVTSPVGIYSSTVSGNTGTWCGVDAAAGGVQSFNRDMLITDSTIAFNAFTNSHSLTRYGAGVHLATANELELQNTIIAGNMTELDFTDLEPDDIGGAPGSAVSGGNNLVYFPVMSMPAGTIQLVDPRLRPLDENGGPTATHMPNFGSAVIDAGNNVSGVTVDQRSTGFPRILGTGPDIGAVEFDLADSIFSNGFD
jgi:hypothetical protein